MLQDQNERGAVFCREFFGESWRAPEECTLATIKLKNQPLDSSWRFIEHTAMRTATYASLATMALLLGACSSAPIDITDRNAPSSSPSQTEFEVIVSSPVSDSIIKSPVSVSGMAKGTWFFEGNIPVSLEADDGTVIAQVGAMAESEWMTEDFVPFSTEISFTTTGSRGVLVIRKDNPSGEPQFDAEFKVPVRFR